MAVYCNSWSKRFQSTFPRGERLYNNTYLNHFKYFNPRSLVGNDGVKAQWGGSSYISIHVPSWGTTASGDPSTAPDRISIHVPSWGTTVCPQCRKKLKGDFNPRSLVGNDGKFSQIFFVFLCNKYNFSTFYYPFSLFFSVIHVTFLIFVVRILPAFYVYF